MPDNDFSQFGFTPYGPSEESPQSPAGDMWSSLLPFLFQPDDSATWQEDQTFLDPTDWLANYGMYLTPYDTEPNITLQKELALSQSAASEDYLKGIEDIQKGIAMSGFGGSYLGDRAALARDKFALELQANQANALMEQRAAEQAWQGAFYGDLSQLAAMGAFTPGGQVAETPAQDFELPWTNPWSTESQPVTSQGCECSDGTYSMACCSGMDDEFLGQEIPDMGAYQDPSGDGWCVPGGGCGYGGQSEADFAAFQQWMMGQDPLTTGGDVDMGEWGYEGDWWSDPSANPFMQNEEIYNQYFGEQQEEYQQCISGADTQGQVDQCYDYFNQVMTETYNTLAEDWYCDPDDVSPGTNCWGGVAVSELCDENSLMYNQEACLSQYNWSEGMEGWMGEFEGQTYESEEGQSDFDFDIDTMEDDYEWGWEDDMMGDEFS